MSAHAQFMIETGLPVYFADPQSPWQRGSNENTNGLLRQYFPKGTDLARWSAEEIEAVAATLNNRPAWRMRAAARPAIVDYIAWFNGTRLHSALGYTTPDKFETATGKEDLAKVA